MMSVYRRFLAASLVLLVPMAARASDCAFCDLPATSNLLVNPGIENGIGQTNITGWTLISSGAREDTNAWGFTAAAMHEGDYALKGWWNDLNCYQSNLPVIGGKSYQASAFFYHSSTEDVITNSELSTRMFMAVEWRDGSDSWLGTDSSVNHNGLSPADVWTQITMHVVAPTGAVKATFHVETDNDLGSGSIFGDSFFFGEVSHPGLGWKGTVLDDCDSLDNWSINYDSGSTGSLAVAAGVFGSAVQMDWDIDSGEWVQAKLTFPEPRDLTEADIFGLSIHGGGTNEELNSVAVMVADTNGVFYGCTYAHSENGLNQVDRWLVNVTIPKKALGFYWGPSGIIDWSAIDRFYVVVKRPSLSTGGGSGVFLVDHVQYDKAADWPRQNEFAQITPDVTAQTNAIGYLLSEQRTNGLIVSWKEEPTPLAWLYDLSLALIALTREGEWEGLVAADDAAEGAELLAEFLLDEQYPDGHWPRAWNADTGEILSTDTWIGDQAWCVLALSLYAQKTWNTSAWASAKACAGWIAPQIDGDGKVHASTEANCDTWWAMRVALKTNEAATVRDYLLDSNKVWDADLRYWWVGTDEAQIATDCATWLAAFAAHPSIGETNRGLHALKLVELGLRATSDDLSLCGISQARGPLSVLNEWSAQYVAAGGEHSQEMLDMLVSQQYADGAMPSSPDNWGNGPFGGAWQWRGVAPTTWFYLALTGQPFPVYFGAVCTGTVTYSGAQVGSLRAVCTNSIERRELPISAAGHTIDGLEIGNSYSISIYCDSNGNGEQDEWEAWGSYSNNPVSFTNHPRVVDVALTDPDLDGDQIPDYWEVRHFGDRASCDPAVDSDTDGNSNLQEFGTDTIPTNAASVFTNLLAVAGEGPEWFLQTRPGTTNTRSYRVYWKSNLVGGADWEPVGDGALGDPLGAALEFTVTNEAPAGYFRTGIRLP